VKPQENAARLCRRKCVCDKATNAMTRERTSVGHETPTAVRTAGASPFSDKPSAAALRQRPPAGPFGREPRRPSGRDLEWRHLIDSHAREHAKRVLRPNTSVRPVPRKRFPVVLITPLVSVLVHSPAQRAFGSFSPHQAARPSFPLPASAPRRPAVGPRGAIRERVLLALRPGVTPQSTRSPCARPP